MSCKVDRGRGSAPPPPARTASRAKRRRPPWMGFLAPEDERFLRSENDPQDARGSSVQTAAATTSELFGPGRPLCVFPGKNARENEHNNDYRTFVAGARGLENACTIVLAVARNHSARRPPAEPVA